MTARDPRSRGPLFPESGSGRIDPTQSLSLDDESQSHPSLALGTHEAQEKAAREERTRIESPNAKAKPEPPKRPPPVPKNALEREESELLNKTLGSYKVIELLGKGGMGYVFRAEHVKLGREVALKLLRADYAKRRDAVARFFQEARTVNRVRHRNIVDVTDFVELDDGTTFIIMEFLRGQSLGRWARTGIDMPRALAVLVQICDGLAAAHSVGVVHRDLKPDNIIVVPTSDGAELVKLLDFGVAKLLNHHDEDFGFQTAAGSVIGTPAYMSPEQAGGMAIDARSDIYSLGAIMYELFCGTPMFKGRSFGEYVRKHLSEMPVPPSQTEAGKLIDPRLEALIMCCLQKDPFQRFATIQNLREALLGILGAIETHPPGYATANHSLAGVVSGGVSGVSNNATVAAPSPLVGARVGPVLASSVAAVMPTMLPSGPQQMATIAAMPGAPVTGMMSLPSGQHVLPGHTSSVVGYQQSYTHHPSTYVPGRTPWWVWAVGGSIAAALGIAAAVWFAGKDDPQIGAPLAAASEPTRPEAEPIETDPKARSVEVRFDSIPSGAVYAEGKTAELCKTPCTYNIDVTDGGAADRRNFIVRSEGYSESAIVVDLSPSAPRDFKVRLDTLPTIAPKQDEVVVKTQLEPEDVVKPDVRPVKRGTTSGRKTTTTAKQTTTTPSGGGGTKLDLTPEPVVTKKEPEKKPDKKVDKKIDQAQTLDPFAKKKSN